jgi:endogenous inhibitor of DNA gyrase (YacG/DUF329 family)
MTDSLGRCPRCDEPIPRRNYLIAYDTADGQAVYAECPVCVEPVHPV